MKIQVYGYTEAMLTTVNHHDSTVVYHGYSVDCSLVPEEGQTMKSSVLMSAFEDVNK